MEETIETILQWHKETFPDTTLEEQRHKFSLEKAEYERARTLQDIVEEFADMFIVACGINRLDDSYYGPMYLRMCSCNTRDSMLRDEYEKAITSKMAINRKRKWHKVNGEYRHVDETKLLVCRMAREELEELLVTKGFERVGPTIFLRTVNKSMYYELFLEVDFNDTCLRFAIKTKSLPDDRWVALLEKYLAYESFAEQKLDEILSQCTKIKTALEMINQIAKGK